MQCNYSVLLASQQFDFQRGKSTVDVVLNFIEFIYDSLNRKFHSVGMFADLSKAFNTINHDTQTQSME